MPVPPPMPLTPQQAPPPAQLAPAEMARPVEVEGAPAPHMEPAASRLTVSASRPARTPLALGAVRRRSRLKKQQPHHYCASHKNWIRNIRFSVMNRPLSQ